MSGEIYEKKNCWKTKIFRKASMRGIRWSEKGNTTQENGTQGLCMWGKTIIRKINCKTMIFIKEEWWWKLVDKRILCREVCLQGWKEWRERKSWRRREGIFSWLTLYMRENYNMERILEKKKESFRKTRMRETRNERRGKAWEVRWENYWWLTDGVGLGHFIVNGLLVAVVGVAGVAFETHELVQLPVFFHAYRHLVFDIGASCESEAI